MASYLQLTFKVQKTIDMYRENDKAHVVEWTQAARRWELGGSKASWEFWDTHPPAPCRLSGAPLRGSIMCSVSSLRLSSLPFPYIIPTWFLFPRYSWPCTWRSQISLLNSGSFSDILLLTSQLLAVSQASPSQYIPTVSMFSPALLFTWVHNASNLLNPERKFGLSSPPAHLQLSFL